MSHTQKKLFGAKNHHRMSQTNQQQTAEEAKNMKNGRK